MKKKNVNKLLALGLVSAMTAGMLAGCGSKTESGAGAATGKQAGLSLHLRQRALQIQALPQIKQAAISPP